MVVDTLGQLKRDFPRFSMLPIMALTGCGGEASICLPCNQLFATSNSPLGRRRRHPHLGVPPRRPFNLESTLSDTNCVNS